MNLLLMPTLESFAFAGAALAEMLDRVRINAVLSCRIVSTASACAIVIPAEAGTQSLACHCTVEASKLSRWVPAFAEMTEFEFAADADIGIRCFCGRGFCRDARQVPINAGPSCCIVATSASAIVIPAEAGTQSLACHCTVEAPKQSRWVPAFAGMTEFEYAADDDEIGIRCFLLRARR